MAIQFRSQLRDARLDVIESHIGNTGVTMEIRTLAQPANCAAADVGTVLATINLPADWMAAASGGTKAIAGGPWQDTSADASGTALHFRIKQGGNTHIQGSVGQGTGDLQLDNNVLVAGQTVSITGFTLTDGNA